VKAAPDPGLVAQQTWAVLGASEVLPNLTRLYKDLHRHPELAGQEHRTGAAMAGWLARAGADVTSGVGGTGVVGLLSNGDGPAVLIRADMDGLPIAEDTGLAYASNAVATGADGQQVPVMHACGHDVHVAALAGTVQALASCRGAWRGTVLAVAQPAEETGTGAASMLGDGLYERFGRPGLVLGQHVDGFGVGEVAHAAGTVTSAAVNLDVRIPGRGGHGSSPESCIDPVVVAACVVLRLQTIVSREVSPAAAAVVTVGSIHAGAVHNVIPDEARLAINVRYQDEQTGQRIIAAIDRIVRAECAAGGCPAEPAIATSAAFPMLRNDEKTVGLVRAVHTELLGDAHVHALPPSMGSEDFPVFSLPAAQAPVPCCYWTFGGFPRGMWAKAAGDTFAARLRSMPHLHTARFAPDPLGAIRTGLAALTSAALAFLLPDAGEPRTTTDPHP
jgi:amidohydrolase